MCLRKALATGNASYSYCVDIQSSWLSFWNKTFLSWRNPLMQYTLIDENALGKKAWDEQRNSSILDWYHIPVCPPEHGGPVLSDSQLYKCYNSLLQHLSKIGSTTFWAFHKCQVSNCPIMHTKFQIRSWNSNKNLKKDAAQLTVII